MTIRCRHAGDGRGHLQETETVRRTCGYEAPLEAEVFSGASLLGGAVRVINWGMVDHREAMARQKGLVREVAPGRRVFLCCASTP